MKKDILKSFTVGVGISICLLPVIYNNFAAKGNFWLYAIVDIIALPIISVSGILIARFISRFMPSLFRLAKFINVGVLNTTMDIGIFNIFILVSGATKGIVVGGVNVPGFAVAVANSYFWNKFWVFEDQSEKKSYGDFVGFFVVSFLGLLINSAAVIIITTYIPHLLGLNDIQWANLAKFMSAFINLAWNFTGYKLFVFKKKEIEPPVAVV